MTNLKSYVITAPLSREEARVAANLHVTSFPNFFLTALGPRFLTAFYSGIVDHPDGIAIHVKYLDQTVGIAYGSISPSGFYKSLLRRNLRRFALSAAWPVARSPRSLLHIVRMLGTSSSNANLLNNHATLLSLAVRVDFQRRGYGKATLEAFEREVIRKGRGSISLLTNRDHNDNVNKFYMKNGFDVVDEKFASNRWMNLYTKKLTSREGEVKVESQMS